MKVGDLVRCVWHPGVSHVNEKKEAVPMHQTVEGELGIVVRVRFSHDGYGRYTVAFPQLDCTHTFAPTALVAVA